MKLEEVKDRFFDVLTKQLLPGAAIGVGIALLFCSGDIALSAILIALAAPGVSLLLLVLLAACNWVYE